MTDEKASQMAENIGKRVKYYVILFAILILFLIWGNTIVGMVTKSILGAKEEAELVQKIIASVITAIGALALVLVNLGRDIDLHNVIDRHLFKVRSTTNTLIHNTMIEAAESVKANGWRNMPGKPTEVLYLFYHFANEQTTLRSLAFTYWEQYFVNIYILCLSSVGLLISGLIVLFRWKLDFTLFSPILFLIIVLAIGLSTRYSLLSKIYSLPVQQIEEMRNSKAAELKMEVERRFGGLTP